MAKTRSIAFDMHVRAQEAIAHGALTNSKRPECLVKGVYPTHLKRGLGAHVWDTQGRGYVDFICGLGSSILGYAHTEVTQAITDQARMGTCLSLGTALEVETAEKVKELFPFVERLRFLKTGSDACSAAVRIARAATGRDLILSAGYHGWHDDFVSLTPPAVGVPPREWAKSLVSPEEFQNVAAVIVEPIGTDASAARVEYLKALREACTKAGAVLIFDEVITGFRYPNYCVSRFYGIEPDLICLGKAMANGMPLSVVGGRKAVMECGQYFVSSTFAGETLSLAAAMKTMTLLQTKYSLDHLWEKGGQFQKGFNAIWPEGISIVGYPTRGVFQGDTLTKALFWQEACRAGILFGPSFFFNFAHIDLMDHVLSTCNDILLRVRSGMVRLEGELPASPFAQRVRGQ